MRYLFGPLPSRRYGRSLGVDLCVLKTCTIDCCFCQLGHTQKATLERVDRPPMLEILAELRSWLVTETAHQPVDFITASGSGEPSLHSKLGDLFRMVRAETPYRSLLLSNGSLFFRDDVRRDAALADVVKVSLHAWDQTSFERIVHPHPDLKFDAILDGYRAFRDAFSGRLDLEVFIVPGLNDSDEAVARIAALARSFSPDDIALNTAVRPAADAAVQACSSERLHALSQFFGVHAHETGAQPELKGSLDAGALEAVLKRHPVKSSDRATHESF